MFNKYVKLIFAIAIFFCFAGVFSGCNSKTYIEKQPTNTAEIMGLSEKESQLLGMWHAMPNVASGYAERFWFDKDRNYKYIPNSMNESQGIDWGIGKWSIKGNNLYLLKEKTSSGELLKTPIEEVLVIGTVETADENAAYPYKIKIGDNYYWKISDENLELDSDLNNKVGSSTSPIKHNSGKPDDLKQLVGSTAGNINSGGMFGAAGEWIFFQSAADGNKLYKSKIDGAEKIEVTGEIAQNINVIGDWLFFTTDETGNLFKIKIDGTSMSMLSEEKVYDIRVVGNWVYYLNTQDRYSLYRINMDGSNEMKIFEGTVGCFDISDDWIYLYDESSEKLVKLKTDGSEVTKISDEKFNELMVQNGWIFYSNPDDRDRIYKVKVDGTEKTKICDEPSTRVNVKGEWIYYIDSIFFNINRIRLDGTGKTKLNNVQSENLHVFDEWILYDEDISGENSPGNPYYKHFKMKIDGTGKEAIE